MSNFEWIDKLTGPDLKKWRQDRGLTGQYVADELGVTKTTVFVVESKARPIPRPWRWYIKYKESEEMFDRVRTRKFWHYS